MDFNDNNFMKFIWVLVSILLFFFGQGGDETKNLIEREGINLKGKIKISLR